MGRLLAALISVAATGCAHVPIPENPPVSTQRIARAAHHWRLLAQDVVAQIGPGVSPQLMAGRAVRVHAPSETTPFTKAFTNMLVTELVRGGTGVTRADESNAIEVRYETQVIVYGGVRSAYRPGTFSILTGGLLVLRHALNYPADALLGTAAAVGATDYVMSTSGGHPTHTELLVTTSVVEGNKYLSRQTDISYVPDLDVGLFLPCKPGRDGRLCRELTYPR